MKNSLNRFLEAQEDVYETALSEIKSGQKRSHWMWFIFPQYKGLGYSDTSKYYAIDSLEEANEYLNHPILGRRLKEISNELLLLEDEPIEFIFGSPDNLKLRSCMTLFSEIDDSEDNVFIKVIEQYFSGKLDHNTLLLMNQ
mgnify:FL=1